MKMKMFNLIVRTFSVTLFSFAAFLPIFAWDSSAQDFLTEKIFLCILGGFLSGSGYGVYRFLQDINRENEEMRYNIRYEHTTVDIKERASL